VTISAKKAKYFSKNVTKKWGFIINGDKGDTFNHNLLIMNYLNQATMMRTLLPLPPPAGDNKFVKFVAKTIVNFQLSILNL